MSVQTSFRAKLENNQLASTVLCRPGGYARRKNPIPSRTRPLSSSAPMVLCLKARESRSLPGLQRTVALYDFSTSFPEVHSSVRHALAIHTIDAGWSSPVARQAHNLKVTGSNPVPATKYKNPASCGVFCILPELWICASAGPIKPPLATPKRRKIQMPCFCVCTSRRRGQSRGPCACIARTLGRS